MNGYKHVFDNSINLFQNTVNFSNINDLLNNFRGAHQIYGFILALKVSKIQ